MIIKKIMSMLTMALMLVMLFCCAACETASHDQLISEVVDEIASIDFGKMDIEKDESTTEDIEKESLITDNENGDSDIYEGIVEEETTTAEISHESENQHIIGSTELEVTTRQEETTRPTELEVTTRQEESTRPTESARPTESTTDRFSSQEESTTVKVEVNNKISVTGVSISKTSITLKEGESQNIVITVKPDNATNKYVLLNSSNTHVATIDAYGEIKANGVGKATITVITKDGECEAECEVTVLPKTVLPSNVSLNKTNTSLKVGEVTTLVASVSPSNVTNKNVTFSSSNSSVAKVDSSGKVTAVGNGTAIITVETVDGGKSATCTVEVTKPNVVVTGVKITNKADIALDVNSSTNRTYKCAYAVSPANATNKNVTFSSSNSSVAKVDSSGNITAVGIGKAIITIKAANSAKTDSINVYVYKSNADIPVGGNIWYRISVGSAFNRVIDVYDGNTFNGSRVQIYTSNDSDAQIWQFHNYITSHGGIAIVPRCNSGAYIFDVNRGSSYATPFKVGNKIDLWTLGEDNAASMWQLVKMWDGSYIFRLINTNYVAGVTSTDIGSQLVLKEFNPFDMNQRWFLEPVEVKENSTSQGIEAAINWAKTQMNQGNKSYSYWCLKFIGDAFRAGGINNAGYITATQAGNKLITSTNTNPPRGAVVFWNWYGSIDGVYDNYGHVGISLGNGQVIHADYDGIKITGLDLGSRTYRGWGMWK